MNFKCKGKSKSSSANRYKKKRRFKSFYNAKKYFSNTFANRRRTSRTLYNNNNYSPIKTSYLNRNVPTIGGKNLKDNNLKFSLSSNSTFLLQFSLYESFKYIPIYKTDSQQVLIKNCSLKGVCLPIIGYREKFNVITIPNPNNNTGAKTKNVKRIRNMFTKDPIRPSSINYKDYQDNDSPLLNDEEELNEEIREEEEFVINFVPSKENEIKEESINNYNITTYADPIIINFGIIVKRNGINAQLILQNFKLPFLDSFYTQNLVRAIEQRVDVDYINFSTQMYEPQRDLLLCGTATLFWTNGSWNPYVIPKINSSSTPILNIGDELIFVAKRISIGDFAMSLAFNIEPVFSNN